MTIYEAIDLLDVIKGVHRQHADDLCWMPADVNRIFEAAGLPKQDLRVGDRAAMLRNCERYVACLEEGGPWKSYQELELVVEGHVKARELLLKGMESQAELMHDLKQRARDLEAELAELRQAVWGKDVDLSDATREMTRRQAVDQCQGYDSASELIAVERDNLATEVERLRDIIVKANDGRCDDLYREAANVINEEYRRACEVLKDVGT